MTDDADSPVVLGRTGLRLGAIVLLIEVVGVVVAGRLLGWVSVGYPLVVVVGTAWLLLTSAGNTVRLEQEALVVTGPGGRRRYLWADVLEVSWRHEHGGGGSGPVLRVRGGPYDQPGPNLPDQVARLVLFGRRGRERAVQALQEAARTHGVPYSASLERDLGLGRRRPRLPSDEDPRA